MAEVIVSDLKQLLAEIAACMAPLLRRRKPPEITRYIFQSIFMPRVLYRLLFATVAEEDVAKAIQPAWEAYRAGLGTSKSTSFKLMQAMGYGDMWNTLKVDRVMVQVR